MTISLLYVTCATPDEAVKIGRALVEERLAACANVLPGMRSIYWWQGKLAEESECVLILKTRGDLFEAATARVKALHSYSVPCVLELPVARGHQPYIDWLMAETAPAKR
jgi:periplasmic divalent cation tolerance protein